MASRPGPIRRETEVRNRAIAEPSANRGRLDPNGHQASVELPSLVAEVIARSGQPLDSRTRNLMESRFGHDFGRIRVHSDSAAANALHEAGSLALATGDDVAFAPGVYRPETLSGQATLAHELAHVVQQAGARPSGGDEVGLDRAADEAAIRVAIGGRAVVTPASTAPAVQYLKATNGALGKALEAFTNLWNVPNRAVVLLMKSPTFRGIAATIDANYVWRGDSYKDKLSPDYGPDGRIAKGPFAGKRELHDVMFGPAKFEPMEAPPEHDKNKLAGDVIWLSGTATPEFIQQIAHEATHAARFVGATTPTPATLIAEINAGITEEVETRKSEAKVLREIPEKAVRTQAATVGSRVAAEVERDISPGFGLTYLENFFFGARLREAQVADGLSDGEAEAIREQAEKEVTAGHKISLVFRPRPGPSGIFELSDYAKTWVDRRTAQVEWEAFHKAYRPTDPDFAAEKEKLVQDHARRFFSGRVSYSSLPAPVRAPAGVTP